jgi:hypothetical protein
VVGQSFGVPLKYAAIAPDDRQNTVGHVKHDLALVHAMKDYPWKSRLGIGAVSGIISLPGRSAKATLLRVPGKRRPPWVANRFSRSPSAKGDPAVAGQEVSDSLVPIGAPTCSRSSLAWIHRLRTRSSA